MAGFQVSGDESFAIELGPTIESYRYVGPEGEVVFEEGRVYWKGKPVLRHGHEIDVISATSFHPPDTSGRGPRR